MITHRAPAAPRRTPRRTPGRTLGRTLGRTAQVAATAAALVLGSMAVAPAFADTPVAWPVEPHVSGWDFLVVLLLIPLAVFVLVFLAVSLPYFKRARMQPGGEPWGERREWFGGPRTSLDAADEVSPEALEASEHDTGGASGRW